MHCEERSGNPSYVTDDLKGKVKVKFRKSKQFTISKLHEHFTDACRSLVHENVTNRLRDFVRPLGRRHTQDGRPTIQQVP